MSATTTPTLLNLPPLPKPRTVNELANSINYTYSEINRAFNIISRAFKFDKTVTTGNTTVTGTQIGGFLITADSLVSTVTTTGLSISLNSANATTSYALVVGDVPAGTRALTIGNGVVYGHLVEVAGFAVAQMRRGLLNNHGYLSIVKTDNTLVFVADGNANTCAVGGTLSVGSNLTVTGSITTALLQFSGGGSLYFPGAFIPTAPAATGYLVARDNGGFYYKLLAAPYP